MMEARKFTTKDKGRPPETKTLDQVVAANVKRLRVERGWTVNQLADHLGVGQHLVYDFEGTRTDRAQRAFRWSDLVALCEVLRCTIFDLVLPPEDVGIARTSREFGVSVGVVYDRGRFGETIFGIAREHLTPDQLAHLPKSLPRERKETEKRIQELARRFVEVYRETMEEE